MAFENGGVPEEWRYVVISPLYKDKKKNVGITEVLAC